MFLEWIEETGGDGKKRKVKRQTKFGAFVFVDEGQGLLSMSDRNGTTIMPIMRSAWSGATLGQQNASQETNRRVGAHMYRIGMVLGFQLQYAARLIADAEGGTPQRFVFVNASDPTVPDEPPPWPGPLDIVVPPKVSSRTVMRFDEEVADGIRRRGLMATRGTLQGDPLDSHADLGRMKIAALLAILDGCRLDVGIDDWELAGMIMRTSRSVRTWAIEEANSAARRDRQARYAIAAEEAVNVDDVKANRALVAGARIDRSTSPQGGWRGVLSGGPNGRGVHQSESGQHGGHARLRRRATVDPGGARRGEHPARRLAVDGCPERLFQHDSDPRTSSFKFAGVSRELSRELAITRHPVDKPTHASTRGYVFPIGLVRCARENDVRGVSPLPRTSRVPRT